MQAYVKTDIGYFIAADSESEEDILRAADAKEHAFTYKIVFHDADKQAFSDPATQAEMRKILLAKFDTALDKHGLSSGGSPIFEVEL